MSVVPPAVSRRAAALFAVLDDCASHTFVWLWFAQSISLLGSHMTTFAFGVWLYQRTGQATALALAALFGYLPAVLVGIFAGVVVDRYSRKWIMLLADGVQALATLTLLVLLATGWLAVWMIYSLLALSSIAVAFQEPAQDATTSLYEFAKHIVHGPLR